MADVIAIVADVIATIAYCRICGRCNSHLLLADVITKCEMADVFAKYEMADVIATCGRWNSHFFVMG